MDGGGGLVIAAGAGMGVDSGLPDFRGPEGFWRTYPAYRQLGLRFEQLANPAWFERDAQLAWGFYGHRLNLYRETVPHQGFAILRRWLAAVPAGGVVYTSNVDGQFQKAGFSEDQIVEVHGSLHHLQCLRPRCHGIWSAEGLHIRVDDETFRTVGELQQSTGGQFIALDGKALRRSFAHGWDKTPIHLVSAYASQNQLILGQLKVDTKENEIVAIPKLLELLNLRQATLTIDAIGCQKAIAGQITQAHGDYVLALKENQPALYEGVKKLLDEAILEQFKGLRHDVHEEHDGDHGRIETRRVWVTDELQWLKTAAEWPGLRQLVVVERNRDIYGKTSSQRHYYIASHRALDAQRTATAIRSHWGIENQVHWMLDLTFHEDQSRIRKADGAENFSRIRRMVLNKLRAYQNPQDKKYSLRMKRKMCGWNFEYFLKVFTA
ncbi:MAG: ISAs1 family transposase [Phycisphaerae bacterium]